MPISVSGKPLTSALPNSVKPAFYAKLNVVEKKEYEALPVNYRPHLFPFGTSVENAKALLFKIRQARQSREAADLQPK